MERIHDPFDDWTSEEGESDADDSPAPHFIDPELLEAKCEDCVCGVCLGVMQKPASGCREGHSFCRACLTKALRKQRRCPTCRQHISWTSDLVPNRTAENIIATMKLRCEGSEAARPSAAKRARLAPAASLTAEALKNDLQQRGLATSGNKPEQAARLEEDRKKDAGCRWRGRVGELSAHRDECAWGEVKCPHKGCMESPLRMDLPEHEAICGHRQVACSYCFRCMARHSLVAHQRGGCVYGQVACPCPGCDALFFRKDIDAHFKANHSGPGR